ncbi:hypothetical protein MATR_23050 [Marivirga tractuosa]|uniref:Uncharacterized protein n=1 Tax=Marivirga tractuosa (strain ATCC 23168 / DSM 4126 / NBRC 15989 / NCIMB 1408 / VKM B-1430 / H-43) TaxID=643867 RepID=E4TVF3_MARTH|nr:hypothetical protein [Marivirga tractuosa]ADR20085.1 hypothetical protein Ftrac_0070 [Marivirga tractuosa DSM 4126]BDD15480.1 hypothetical protein MATR_23050 [Marivirga tractuosa]
MEDYKILIYIVLSILYFLFKGRGKKKKPVTRKKADSQQAEQSSNQKKRPKSFEELLAELSGENLEKEEETQSGDEILRESEEIKSLSEQVDERPMHQQVSQEDYENADETLKELYKKGEKLKSIDELVNIDKVSTQSNRFKEFEDQSNENQFAQEIREGLSDPESAKKAIVYAEILNRKY